MGYYHETPEDELFDPTLYAILDELARNGVVVVCSAGNDATSRPSFPAAFGPWSDGAGPIPFDADDRCRSCRSARSTRTGTDALFSNAGPWVRAYVAGCRGGEHHAGASEGGYEPVARTQRLRPGPRGDRPGRLPGRLRRVERYVVRAPLLAGRRRGARWSASLETGDAPVDAAARGRRARGTR